MSCETTTTVRLVNAENVLLGGLAGHGILAWKQFPSRVLKTLLHYFLTSRVTVGRSCPSWFSTILHLIFPLVGTGRSHSNLAFWNFQSCTPVWVHLGTHGISSPENVSGLGNFIELFLWFSFYFFLSLSFQSFYPWVWELQDWFNYLLLSVQFFI